MSLLMDALKKAEEEKKRSAKQLEEVEAASQTEKNQNDDEKKPDAGVENKSKDKLSNTAALSLEPLDSRFDETVNESKEAMHAISEKEIPTVDATDSFSEELTLENPVVDEGVLEETQEAAVDLNDTTIIEGLSTEDSSAPFDDTFHGVLFDEDDKSSVAYEETLPGVPADQLVKDLGGGKYQPTPVAAQTVFSAGQTESKKRSFKWGVLIVLSFLAMGSFAVFYYFTITPVVRKLPSPAIARGVEPTFVPSPSVINKINSPEKASKVINAEIEGQAPENSQQIIAQQQPASGKVPEPEMTSSNDDVQAQVVDETLTEDKSVKFSTENPVLAESDNKINDTQKDEKTDTLVNVAKTENVEQETASPVNEYIQPNLSLINISKKVAPKKTSVMVNEAFKAYEANQYDVAKSLYQDVVKNEPDNRDAHLGLAAIAIKNKNYKSAYEHYLHVLSLNPEDALAHNALINLTNNSNLVNDESTIKTLLQKEGDAPYLYFSLGTIYAKQLRWANAQEAFFEAYRLDTTNADYVLNLAISLDHIGQYATAQDYYKTAIELAQRSPASFDYVSVNNRIIALSNILESKP